MYDFFGNLHTANFYIKANKIIIEEVIKANSKRFMQIDDDRYCLSMDDMTIFVGLENPFISIFVDLIKLLRKNVFDEKDIHQINQLIQNKLNTVYSFDEEPVLTRVDIRIDIKMEKRMREIYIDLLSNSLDKRRNLCKHIYEEESVQYKSDAKYESVRLNLYDKPIEQLKKKKKPEMGDKDIVRLEIQLFNRHLNYMERRYGVKKELENYLSDRCRLEYTRKYLVPVLFMGDYLKINKAYFHINNCSLKSIYKKELKLLLRKVKKNGVSYTKRMYSINRWNKFIGFLDDLNINPITLPNDCEFDKVINPIKNIIKCM